LQDTREDEDDEDDETTYVEHSHFYAKSEIFVCSFRPTSSPVKAPIEEKKKKN